MSETNNGGIGFFGLLQIVLIVLKLTGLVAISWFWTLFPAILLVSILIVICVVALVVGIAVHMLE